MEEACSKFSALWDLFREACGVHGGEVSCLDVIISQFSVLSFFNPSLLSSPTAAWQCPPAPCTPRDIVWQTMTCGLGSSVCSDLKLKQESQQSLPMAQGLNQSFNISHSSGYGQAKIWLWDVKVIIFYSAIAKLYVLVMELLKKYLWSDATQLSFFNVFGTKFMYVLINFSDRLHCKEELFLLRNMTIEME